MQIEKLLTDLRNSYFEQRGIQSELRGLGIHIIDDFIENWETILEFNRKFYCNGIPKTVICGVNPGRLGAGKTGVPFLDFNSLSQLIPGLNRYENERSAKFFFDIVEHFEAEKFYKNFYVTNISWVGFIKDDKNLNYYLLPDKIKKKIYELFLKEMSYVQPQTIISLSKEVQNSAKEIFGEDINTDLILAHPNYCAFPSNYNEWKKKYLDVLGKFVTKSNSFN